MTLIVVASILLFSYSILLLYYKIQWDVLSEVETDEKIKPRTKVSIIIPARNEEDNIGRLLDSIQQQNYNKKLFEVIVIDDFSTDRTAEIIKSFDGVKYFHLSEWVNEKNENSFKKKALSEAIKIAEGELIVTTDADCEVGKNWLKAIAQKYEQLHYKAMAAPVMFFEKKSLLNIFQELDFVAMQGITAAVLSSKKGAMCNGANFIFTKKAFEEVGGYEGINHLASGDDMMLMHKFQQQFPNQLAFIKNKDAIVQTQAMDSMSSFVQQRIRWAGKNKSLLDKKIQIVLLLSWLMNASILASLVSLIYNMDNVMYVILLFVIKGIAEYFFCGDVAVFFNRKKRLPFLFILQPLHILYMTFVGFLGMFNTYTWKKRKVK